MDSHNVDYGPSGLPVTHRDRPWSTTIDERRRVLLWLLHSEFDRSFPWDFGAGITMREAARRWIVDLAAKEV